MNVVGQSQRSNQSQVRFMVGKLSAMRKRTDEIWDETERRHPVDIDQMEDLIVSVYEWKTFAQGKEFESSPLLAEALLDILGSLNSILNGYYRQGMFSLRSCLEMVAGFTYYVDHPLEFKRWRLSDSNDADSKLSKWLEDGFMTQQYVKFFVPEEKVEGGLDSRIRELYRKLSKFIHAQKEDNMQFDKDSIRIEFDEGRFNRSRDYFIQVARVCNLTLTIRFWKDLQSKPELRKSLVKIIGANEAVKM